MNPTVAYLDWGMIDYKEAWELQTDLHQRLISLKRKGQNVGLAGYFILCEHPPVYTLGKSGKEDHLLIGEEERKSKGYNGLNI